MNFTISLFCPCVLLYQITMKEDLASNQQKFIQSQYRQYYDRATIQCRKLTHQPAFDRSLKNQGFVFMMLAITILFFSLAAYLIIVQSQANTDFNSLVLFQYKVQIGSCLGICITLSAFYVAILNFSPKNMVYALIIGCGLILACVSVVCYIQQIDLIATLAMVILIIYSIIVACLWQKIVAGINLLETGLRFINKNLIIFVLPVVQLILTALFSIFWLYTINILFYRISQKQESQQEIDRYLIGFWYFVWLFYIPFFYYTMVFCIGVLCAFQFYQIKERSALCTAYKWLISSIGSITFLSLIVCVVKFFQFFLQRKNRQPSQKCCPQNCCPQNCCQIQICRTKYSPTICCYGMISCIMGSFQRLIQVMDNSSIIVMAVTGQSLGQAASTTMGLVCKNIYLMSVTKVISNLLVSLGVIFSTGITSLIAYFWLQGLQVDSKQIGDILGLIFFSSFLMSAMTLSIISETTTCAFIFYMFQQSFTNLRLKEHYISEQTAEIFRNSTNPVQTIVSKKKKKKKKKTKKSKYNNKNEHATSQDGIFQSIITSE